MQNIRTFYRVRQTLIQNPVGNQAIAIFKIPVYVIHLRQKLQGKARIKGQVLKRVVWAGITLILK